jgi:hypothetical protein
MSWRNAPRRRKRVAIESGVHRGWGIQCAGLNRCGTTRWNMVCLKRALVRAFEQESALPHRSVTPAPPRIPRSPGSHRSEAVTASGHTPRGKQEKGPRYTSVRFARRLSMEMAGSLSLNRRKTPVIAFISTSNGGRVEFSGGRNDTAIRGSRVRTEFPKLDKPRPRSTL